MYMLEGVRNVANSLLLVSLYKTETPIFYL